MLRLTRTAIGLLTAQYRSVLRKCWAINVGIFGLMGKAAASVAKGAADTIGGTLNGYGINVIAYMLGLLDSLLNIKSNAFGEQSAKAPATKLPFGAPTVAGTLTAFGVNVMDSILLNLQSKKFVTLKALPAAVVAATVMATTLTAMPTEAEALRWCIATSTSTTPLRLVADNTSCPSGYTNFGTQSGNQSSAVGFINTASGVQSSAFGWQNTAGTQSSAFGWLNNASENFSSAFGTSNTSSGGLSSAFGYGNTASGYQSSAFGYGNRASGEQSSAFGIGNNASGKYSSVFGYYSYAAKDYTTANRDWVSGGCQCGGFP